jgi:hypothetical protein
MMAAHFAAKERGQEAPGLSFIAVMPVTGQDGELQYRLPHRCHKLHQDPLAIGRPEQGREGRLGRLSGGSIGVIGWFSDGAGSPARGRNGVLQSVGRFPVGLLPEEFV